MSRPSLYEIDRVSGFVYANPTSTATEAGWGSRLGYSSEGVLLSPNLSFSNLTQMETGSEPVISVYTGCAYVMRCGIKNFNSTTLGLAFPGFRETYKIGFPGLAPGTNLRSSSYLKEVLFVPDDTERHPAVYLANCSAFFDPRGQVHLHHVKDIVIQILFWGGSVQVDLLENIVLS